MDRLENVATPPAAATVSVPDSVPPPGLVPMATVMLALELVTVLLKASCTVTCTAGAIATPAVAVAGWTVKASFEADAGLTLNPAEVAPVSDADAAASVYPVPTLSMDRLEKVATPPVADTVVVPVSVPPPGLVPMATVMLAVELVTVLLKTSCTVTCTAGEMLAPAVALDGWTVKASLDAAPAVMLKPEDVAPVSAPDA